MNAQFIHSLPTGGSIDRLQPPQTVSPAPLNDLNAQEPQDEFRILEPVVTINDLHTEANLETLASDEDDGGFFGLKFLTSDAVYDNYLGHQTDKQASDYAEWQGHMVDHAQEINEYEFKPARKRRRNEVQDWLLQYGATRSSHRCSKCPYKTASKRFLQSHMRQNHSPYLSFVCQECGFKAWHNCTLQLHRLIHTEENSKRQT